jgi:putative ABC transport system permease protein
MHTLWQDLRYGARMLLKKPGFTLIAALTLALGIGANTAIFSVVNAVLIQPLPFAEPDRLVWMWGAIRNGSNRTAVAPLDFLDYREQNKSFEQFAAMKSVPVYGNLTGSGDPERLEAALVTGNYFQALGVKPALGRAFLLENEQPGRDRVVVLSHGLWQRRFGADRTIVNRTITLDGRNYEVLGVMPPGLKFPRTAEMWAPMNFDSSPEMKQRRARFLRLIGRLKPGVTLAQAQAEMDALSHRLEEQYHTTKTGWSLRLVPLHERIAGNIKPTLFVLFGAVGFVLLIACVNVANLLLVRAAARVPEMAVRTALGASRRRIVRQMLTESLLLSLFGGALGVLLGAWGVDLLVALSANNIPPTANVKIDAMVLGFTLLVALFTGVLFGLVPALQSSSPNLNEMLKEGGRSATEGARRNRMRSMLVVLESAVAVMLLVGAGLLIRSFIRLQNVSPGFDERNVLTMQISLSRGRYGAPEKARSFFDQLQQRLHSLPGVESVGMIRELPLNGQSNDRPFTVEGRPPGSPNQRYDAEWRLINQDYFRAMRIPLLRGRNFTDQEVRQSDGLVIISESLSRAVFPNEDPLGKRLQLGQKPYEIVGIVGDIRQHALEIDPDATMYLPTLDIEQTNLVLRTAGDPASIIGAVRKEVMAIDRDQPIASVRLMEQLMYESVAQPRFRTFLIGLFAALALLLAAVGIYGVMSQMVAQRTHEIGIRMALGAQARDVLGLALRHGMSLAIIGIAIGMAGALALTRLMGSLLFEVSATDPMTFAGVAMLQAVVALLACYIPARRATKVDPVVALRCE